MADDDSKLSPTDPDVLEAAADARALVTARMEATALPSPDVDAIVNEMVRKALGATNPYRAVAVQLATLAMLAANALDLATGFLLADAEITTGFTYEQLRSDLRAELFPRLEERGLGL